MAAKAKQSARTPYNRSKTNPSRREATHAIISHCGWYRISVRSQPQRRCRLAHDPQRGCAPLVPASLLARPEPDRAGVLKTQNTAAQSRGKNRRWALATNWKNHQRILSSRMLKLFGQRRICVNLNQNDSRLGRSEIALFREQMSRQCPIRLYCQIETYHICKSRK